VVSGNGWLFFLASNVVWMRILLKTATSNVHKPVNWKSYRLSFAGPFIARCTGYSLSKSTAPLGAHFVKESSHENHHL
jgi:hypothetical protein